SLMRLDQRTTITIPETEESKITSFIDLLEGAIHIITRTPKPFKVRTPFLNAGVEGTEFFVGVEMDHARIIIYEGRVSASNAQGSVMLTDHETAGGCLSKPAAVERDHCETAGCRAMGALLPGDYRLPSKPKQQRDQ
ncbi:MAG TPA: FecR family protein, partial [Nitrosomonas nitrosa]|nr:FecR family protein [Nitrosomonas nitrosa]